MGDFPEPKYHTSMADVKDNTPVMTKIYSTLGRKFNKKDLEDAQRMGTELVSISVSCALTHLLLDVICQIPVDGLSKSSFNVSVLKSLIVKF